MQGPLSHAVTQAGIQAEVDFVFSRRGLVHLTVSWLMFGQSFFACPLANAVAAAQTAHGVRSLPSQHVLGVRGRELFSDLKLTLLGDTQSQLPPLCRTAVFGSLASSLCAL